MPDEPAGQPPGIPVEVICVTSSPPIFAQGRMWESNKELCRVDLSAPEPRLVKGLRVIVDCGDQGPGRILGQVERSEGTLLVVTTNKIIPPDKRVFPRLYGGIQLRYRVVSASRWDRVSRDWMAGFADPAPASDWIVPDPFMDFSVSGLKFEGPQDCGPDDLMLVEMQVPGDDLPRRATARVMRVDPLPLDHDDPKTTGFRQIAVAFVDLPQGAAEALVRFTLQIQEVMMKMADDA
jgi:hypothetical protein